MNEHKSFCEYIVTPETGAKGMLLRVVLMLIYALVAAGYTFFFWILLGQWQPLILLPFIIYALINITWRFVMVEYEFAVEAGELTVAKIYGKKTRRKRFSADISDFTVIRPLDSDSRKLADAPDTELLDLSGTSGQRGPDAYAFCRRRGPGRRRRSSLRRTRICGGLCGFLILRRFLATKYIMNKVPLRII